MLFCFDRKSRIEATAALMARTLEQISHRVCYCELFPHVKSVVLLLKRTTYISPQFVSLHPGYLTMGGKCPCPLSLTRLFHGAPCVCPFQELPRVATNKDKNDTKLMYLFAHAHGLTRKKFLVFVCVSFLSRLIYCDIIVAISYYPSKESSSSSSSALCDQRQHSREWGQLGFSPWVQLF